MEDVFMAITAVNKCSTYSLFKRQRMSSGTGKTGEGMWRKLCGVYPASSLTPQTSEKRSHQLADSKCCQLNINHERETTVLNAVI